MLKVVYYARVSTEEEKQIDALKKQTEELEIFINKNTEWVLADKYVDEGKSGTSTKGRFQYNRLFKDLDTDKFDIVVIKDQSRLMRNVLDWYLFMDLLNKNNKKLFLYLENTFYTPDNAFLTGIKAMMAEEYSRDLSKKISSAAKRSQKNGTVYGSNRMLGYHQEKGKMIIIEDEAKIVRDIFQWYSTGLGFRTIATKLIDMNVKSSNGTEFSLSTLKRMIRNEKYKGLLVSGKRRFNFEIKKYEEIPQDEWIYIENGVPAIVSEELWQKCNDILNTKKDKLKNTGRFIGNYALSGKIVCGKCNKPYWHNSYITAISKEKKHNWGCSAYRSYGKNHKLGCDNITLKHEEIMNICRNIIFEFTNNSEDITSVLEILKRTLKQNNENINIAEKHNKLNKIKGRKDKLLNLLLDELITKEEYNTKRNVLENDILKIENEIEIYTKNNEAVDNKINRLSNIQAYLVNNFNNSKDIPDEMIKSFIKQIIVLPDNIKIVLNTEHQYNVDILKDNKIEFVGVSEYRLIRSHTEITDYSCIKSQKELFVDLVVNI